MAGWLDGKVAIVTGGASGIGQAIVERFIQEGAKVCIYDLDAEKLELLSKSLPSGAVATVQGDVTRLEDNRRGVETAVDAFGRLDVFVRNAGLFAGGKIDEGGLRAVVRETARLQGELRIAHLRRHLEMKQILTPEQVKRYDELRGYAEAGAGHEGRAH